MASGLRETRQLRRLLIGLYNWIGATLIKGELKRINKKPFEYPAGPFQGLGPESIFHMTTTVYDDEEDIEIRAKYICSCDEYVFQMGVEGSFACIHCDSVCQLQNCDVCFELNTKDLWENDANL